MLTHRLRTFLLSGSSAALLSAAGCGSGTSTPTLQLLGLLPPRSTVQAILSPTYTGVTPVSIIQMFPSGGMARIALPEPLPQGISGELRAGVGVFDSQRCLLSYGSATSYAGSSLVIELRPLPAPDCRSRVVLLSQVSPPAPRGTEPLTLYGYGFQLGVRVFINGQATARTTFVTPSELSVQPVSALPSGRLSLRVVNPDNNEDTRDDLATVPGLN
jgi:hypothetical protein